METALRTSDLYVTKVLVYNSNKRIIIEEVDNGVSPGHSYGPRLIPIQLYRWEQNLDGYSPGALIRSQALRISESLRFRRSLRCMVATHSELCPEFKTRHGAPSLYIPPFV